MPKPIAAEGWGLSNPNYIKRLKESCKLSVGISNLEENFQLDMNNGDGFMITNPPDNKKVFSRDPNSIYSSQYGGDLTDKEEIVKIFSCDCQQTQGRYNKDRTCQYCNTKVTYSPANIKTTGWIDLKDQYIINPALYRLIEKVIGKSVLANMISFNKDMNKDGNFAEFKNTTPKNPFGTDIGLAKFRENFNEILEFFVRQRIRENAKAKVRAYKRIKEHQDKVFTSKIPIISIHLRPVTMIGARGNDKPTIKTDMINEYYTVISKNAAVLNAPESVTMDIKSKFDNLHEIQTQFLEVYKLLVGKISAKKGQIRNRMLGMRMNYSSRQVIVPLLEDARIDVIHIPYLVFMELYKHEILNILCKQMNMTIVQSYNEWSNSLHEVTSRMMHIADQLIENTEDGLIALINRPPTIYMGSIVPMRVVKVIDNIHDLNLRYPPAVCGVANADFDGDSLSNNSIKSRYVKRHLMNTLSPVFLQIDRSTAHYNSAMLPSKEELLCITTFINYNTKGELYYPIEIDESRLIRVNLELDDV